MTEAASMSGYGFPSGPDWTFQREDESPALYFLRSMAASSAIPDGTYIIIDGDPYSMEPWNLLAAHQSDAAAEGAYFLTKKAMLSSNGMRRKRTVSIADKTVGTWRIQHSKNGSSNADRAPAGETVRWCKTLLSYYNAGNDSTTTGYVMHEYELYKDGCRQGSELGHKGETHEWIICHVKVSDREISRMKRRMKESVAAVAPSRSSNSPSTSPSVGWTNSPDYFYRASADFPLLPASNPHFTPSLALPSPLWRGTLPPPAACETSFVARSTVSAMPFEIMLQEQQPPPTLPAMAEGTAEPPLNCNSELEKDMTAADTFSTHIEKASAEQQQPIRSNSYADAATTAAATHGDDFSDDCTSFAEFDEIDNLYGDDKLDELVGEIAAKPLPDDDGFSRYFL